jgi:serine phosphatase RsbU (regulator of sigma subunit)/HAMP domain-containing protein
MTEQRPDKKPSQEQSFRLRMSITTKILAISLGISLISLSIFSFISLHNIIKVGNYAMEGITPLSRIAIENSTRAMESLGEKMIEQKAVDVARQLEIYIKTHPRMTVSQLKKDVMFHEINMQKIGDTGYIVVMDADTCEYYFHPTKRDLEGQNPRILFKDSLPNLVKILDRIVVERKKEAGGYYAWQDPDGRIRDKYMHLQVVDAYTGDRKQMFIAAATYIDEFSVPARETEKKLADVSRNITEQIGDRISAAERSFIILSVLIILIVGGITFAFSKMITTPFLSLTRGVEEIGKGNLESKVMVRTGDELERLANTFNKMTDDLKVYIKNLEETTSAKERIESELKIAHDIQMGMLPKVFPPFPDVPEFDIYAMLEPAKEVGGDLFDFFFLDDDHLCFTIGDVSGKGMPASLFMVVTKIMVKTKATKGLTPEKVLDRVNQDISMDNPSLLFVTLFFGILNIRTGELQFANGGHNPPLIIRSNGDIGMMESTGGIALGVMEDFLYGSKTVALQRGDLIVLYSDGVTEAMNRMQELYSDKRLIALMRTLKDRSVDEIIRGIIESVDGFCKGEPRSDDITLMAIRFNGPAT